MVPKRIVEYSSDEDDNFSIGWFVKVPTPTLPFLSFYLRKLLSRSILPMQLSRCEEVLEVLQHLGDSRLLALSEKARQLAIDSMRLYAREAELMVEVLGFLADGMEGNKKDTDDATTATASLQEWLSEDELEPEQVLVESANTADTF